MKLQSVSGVSAAQLGPVCDCVCVCLTSMPLQSSSLNLFHFPILSLPAIFFIIFCESDVTNSEKKKSKKKIM